MQRRLSQKNDVIEFLRSAQASNCQFNLDDGLLQDTEK